MHFCDREVKKIKQKFEKCVKFAVFKTSSGGIKEPSWKKIKQQVLELRLFHLHWNVQGKDLFAKEAKFHQWCLKAFTLQYAKLLKKRSHKNARVFLQPSSKQKLTLEMAHTKAFNAVINEDRDVVICNDEVIRL